MGSCICICFLFSRESVAHNPDAVLNNSIKHGACCAVSVAF